MKHAAINFSACRHLLLPSILGLLFAVSPLAYGLPGDMDGTLPVFVATAVVLSLLLVNFVAGKRQPFVWQFNGVDVTLGLYLLYAGCRWMAGSGRLTEPVIFVEWIGLLATYLLCRILPADSRRRLLFFVVLGGGIQALIGLLQWAGILVSGNPLFPATGSFGNPGPYGGYLAIAAVCAFVLWQQGAFPCRGRMLWLPVVLCLIMIALFLSDSRAAWVAFLFPLFFLYLKGKRFGVKITAIFLLTFLLLLLYLYKKPSADARLLIWQSSVGMIQERPLFGHGVGAFQAEYMNYQVRYLDRHPDSPRVLVADNNLVAFNDWIRLLCEQGAVGAILLAALLIKSFRRSSSPELLFARLGLLSWCLFACFSYPASIFVLKMYFPLFVGCLAANRSPVWQYRLSRWAILPAMIAGGFAFCLVLTTYYRYHRAYQKLYSGQYRQENIDFRNKGLSCMTANKHFLYVLSEDFLDKGRYGDALVLKLRLAAVAPTSSLHADVGMLFLEQGDTAAAANHFRLARRMTPGHVTPVYGLFLVARQRQDSLQAYQLARDILRLPVRVMSNRILKARYEAKTYLSRHNV